MGGKYCFWEKVIKDRLASRWGVPPRGTRGGGVFLCFVFGSFSKLIFKVQFEEPNLAVLFCCLCLAFLQSIQELKMTMKLSLCLWPLQVAGFFSLRFTIMFHLNTKHPFIPHFA